MVLKRGIWETRPKHWSSNSNCICFVFVFASNTLQAKVRLSIAWLNVSVLVKKLFRFNSNKCQCSDDNGRALLTNDYSTSVLYSTTCFSSATVSQDVWHLTPPPSHLSIEPLSKTTIFGPSRVAKLLRWVYTWPQIAHLWREHPILVQMPLAPLCPTSACCRAQKDTPTIFGEFDVSPQTVAWAKDLFIVCKPSICLKLSVRCPTFYFYLHR